MSSQVDIFQDSQTDPRDNNVSASLPPHLYKWVILFQWEIKEQACRFKVFERNLFPEIRNEWIEGQLKENSRFKKLKKLSEGNDVFSLFSKVEAGKKLLSFF